MIFLNNTKIFRLLLILFCISIFGNIKAQTDPGTNGSLRVTTDEYDLGDEWYQFPTTGLNGQALRSEARAKIYYPSDLPSSPIPVIFIAHGVHAICYDPNNTNIFQGSTWPCAEGNQMIPNYRGYDYLGEYFASHGFMVVSISLNGVNGIDSEIGATSGAIARLSIIDHHINFWNDWNTIGGDPFGNLFTGKLDMNNIGIIGHSRGGEGAILHSVVGANRNRVKALLSIAPTNFALNSGDLIPRGDIPFCNIGGYCDGDVPEIGVDFYDVRQNNQDVTEATHSVLLKGANHNYFNKVWTDFVAQSGDDWVLTGLNIVNDSFCGTNSSNRFSASKQRNSTKAYVGAFMRRYLKNETSFSSLLNVDDINPPISSGLGVNEVYVSYQPGVNERLYINSYNETSSVTMNTLGGMVNKNLVTKNSICIFSDCIEGAQFTRQLPHETINKLNVAWNGRSNSTWHENIIPSANKDFSNFTNLMFRAGVNYAESSPDRPVHFYVQLIDGSGDTAQTITFNHTGALYYPPGSKEIEIEGNISRLGSAKTMLNTIKIPLTSFSGVDLRDITAVRFVFDYTSNGNIVVSDLMLGNDTGTGSKSVLAIESKPVITMYPNPTSDQLYFDLTEEKSSGSMSYSMYDMQGREIIAEKALKKGQQSISLGEYPSGVYVLKIRNNNNITSNVIIKEN